VKTQINAYDVAIAAAHCISLAAKLRVVAPEHPLVAINIQSTNGRRYVIGHYWPDDEEETQILLEDSLRNWVNFYTTLLCVRLKAATLV
jgi:hypothetical protein